ncbi:MAG: phospholipase D family protein [Povalibacter sp.]
MQLQPRPNIPDEFAPAPSTDSALDIAFQEHEAAHPAESAFRLIVEGPEAFATRARTAQLATRSLDVQTYIWHADLTGMFLANESLLAADRGVKVRLLLDDMDARAKNAGFAAMAAHPNVEVRLFNPFGSRSGTLGFISEGLTSFGRINRRMHNKTWIADNRIAVTGGRNLGDEYFGASEDVNFVDLDFAMIGPVVREASASFDRYWNSASAYPIETLDSKSVNPGALAALRERLAERAKEAQTSKYASALREDDAVQRLIVGDWAMLWSSTFQFIADDPLKVTMNKPDEQQVQVGAALQVMASSAQSSLMIISPYFVPGDATSTLLVDMAKSAKDVRVLTNSLVANDVAAVHGGYSRYRKDLVKGSVKVWELKPQVGSESKSSIFGSAGASLHTKALTADAQTLFVGSYNLDPRSTWLNCEQGVLVGSSTLAQQLQTIFASQTAQTRAWQVTLEDGKLRWSDGQEHFDSDPKASMGRRFQAWLARVLHLDAQL